MSFNEQDKNLIEEISIQAAENYFSHQENRSTFVDDLAERVDEDGTLAELLTCSVTMRHSIETLEERTETLKGNQERLLGVSTADQQRLCSLEHSSSDYVARIIKMEHKYEFVDNEIIKLQNKILQLQHTTKFLFRLLLTLVVGGLLTLLALLYI